MLGKKNLTTILMAGTLAFGTVGCSSHPEYKFEGVINNEQVTFRDNSFRYTNNLEIVREDGTKIMFLDRYKNLRVDRVEITVNNNTTRYDSSSSNPAVKDIVKNSQEIFDEYLQKILDVQTKDLSRP